MVLGSEAGLRPGRGVRPLTNSSFARSYPEKAQARLGILPVLLEAGAHSDVIREAQEIVELALKGMLRQVGIEPPKWHDVGGFLLEHEDRFALEESKLRRLADISGRLRKEHEFAFYGDVDFIPTEEYTKKDSDRAIAEARETVEAAARVIPARTNEADPWTARMPGCGRPWGG